MWQKILGALGVVGAGAATVVHAVNPSMLSGKFAAVYAIVGGLMALFGKHPMADTSTEGK